MIMRTLVLLGVLAATAPATQPEYVASPRYALFLFGAEGEFRVRAVLDKSDADLEYYDVLYLDKDGDGDLTEPEERFTARLNEAGRAAGIALWIRAGDLAVPGTDEVHRDLRFSTIPKEGRKGIWFSMKWRGGEKVSGGASRTGYDSTVWAGNAEDAPILRPTAEGPFSFAIWGSATLARGAANTVSFLIGNPGSGEDTLCYLSDTFLVPEKDRVVAKLRAKTADGRPVEVPWTFTKHC